LSRVEEAERGLSAQIADIMARVKAIKDEMLRLEVEMSGAGEVERRILQLATKVQSDELNALSDSVVGASRSAWIVYDGLAEDHEKSALEGVRCLCKEIEVIAADLLCYSLGH